MVNTHSTIRAIYPVEPWAVTETAFNPEHAFRGETIFSLANGFIGTRGTFEEGLDLGPGYGLEGTFINGFYESQNIQYGELAYGYPMESQTMLNVTNGKVVRIWLGDEQVVLSSGQIDTYRRTLDLRKGTVTRNFQWTSPAGKKVSIRTTRVVSLRRRSVLGIRLEITSLNYNGELRLRSELDGDVTNSTRETNARIDYGPYGRVLETVAREASDGGCALLQRTRQSQLELAVISQTTVSATAHTVTHDTWETGAAVEFALTVAVGETVNVDKIVGYATSTESDPRSVDGRARHAVANAVMLGMDTLLAEQEACLDGLWSRAGVEIGGDPAVEQGLRFNMFQLFQSAGRDGVTSLGAKGLSGEGYEGHYFWDTEMYAVPFFTWSAPEVARKLLEFRFRTLPAARERAREMSLASGAQFPWRTINGREASAYYPAGTAQVHINADIAYAVQTYWDTTGDKEFMAEMGTELLVETARFWIGYGAFLDSKGGRFCINGVTGPDEFAVLVNNNTYTNLLARENLRNACSAVQFLQSERPEAHRALCSRIGLSDGELDLWMKAAVAMYLPSAPGSSVIPQDDSFLDKKPWDIAATPVEKFPLLNHHHPLVVYRHQVSKQADLVLALALLYDQFTENTVRENFHFYDRRTVHESSLSACIFSIVANRIGEPTKAYEYFMRTARLDLDDFHRDTRAGIHCANMAGTWLALTTGFLGVRVTKGRLSVRPRLPEAWGLVTIRFSFQDRTLEVRASSSSVDAKVLNGDSMTVDLNGIVTLLPASEVLK